MMSPGSLEAAGLISQAEYLKVAALTQSASPDAHKKIAGKFFLNCFFALLCNQFYCVQDFFGKVKDKAENMERIIKEKDKHGKRQHYCFFFFIVTLTVFCYYFYCCVRWVLLVF